MYGRHFVSSVCGGRQKKKGEEVDRSEKERTRKAFIGDPATISQTRL